MPSGLNGSGSTVSAGMITVAGQDHPEVVLAAVDASKNPWYMPRLELGKPLESGTGANDTPATAEPLDVGTNGAFIEGDLSPVALDVDHFVVTVPSGATTVNASCGAQRYGSGLQEFMVSLLEPRRRHEAIGPRAHRHKQRLGAVARDVITPSPAALMSDRTSDAATASR